MLCFRLHSSLRSNVCYHVTPTYQLPLLWRQKHSARMWISDSDILFMPHTEDWGGRLGFSTTFNNARWNNHKKSSGTAKFSGVGRKLATLLSQRWETCVGPRHIPRAGKWEVNLHRLEVRHTELLHCLEIIFISNVERSKIKPRDPVTRWLHFWVYVNVSFEFCFR